MDDENQSSVVFRLSQYFPQKYPLEVRLREELTGTTCRLSSAADIFSYAYTALPVKANLWPLSF